MALFRSPVFEHAKGMTTVSNPHTIEHLNPSECWAILRSATTGRVALVHDGVPDIFPVNHVIDHGSIVYRTGNGELFHATLNQEVAFEVDGHDLDANQVWSVVVKGRASERHQITDIVDSLELPLAPWQSGPKPRFVRIEPHQITGRRFSIATKSPVRTAPEETAPEE